MGEPVYVGASPVLGYIDLSGHYPDVAIHPGLGVALSGHDPDVAIHPCWGVRPFRAFMTPTGSNNRV